jgi:hypothetical protein
MVSSYGKSVALASGHGGMVLPNPRMWTALIVAGDWGARRHYLYRVMALVIPSSG